MVIQEQFYIFPQAIKYVNYRCHMVIYSILTAIFVYDAKFYSHVAVFKVHILIYLQVIHKIPEGHYHVTGSLLVGISPKYF